MYGCWITLLKCQGIVITRFFLRSAYAIVALASLSLEVHVHLGVHTAVASIGEIANQADQ